MKATDQRLDVIPKVMQACNMSLFEGIVLTGSMVFGKYHSVHADSDVDMIFIIDGDKITDLKKDPLFQQIPINEDLLTAFSERCIDRFWFDHYVDGIKVNIGVWDRRFMDDFLSLRAGVHKLGTLTHQ